MREIKFRAWNNKTKEIVQLQKMSFKTGKCMPYGYNISYEFDEIMEYTGLEDKNGMEIYEGDILEYEDRYEIGNYSRTTTKIIVVKSLEHYFKTNNSIPNKISEVIGNIYENPDLLEG